MDADTERRKMNETWQVQGNTQVDSARNNDSNLNSSADLINAARQDPLRPQYHFVAPAGWLNDANGVGWRDGIYHLFYQYNPVGAFHHQIHWGHAVSPDLLHWEDRPIALTPGEGADEDGCWSGVLVDSPHGPALIYSGRRGESELPCVAYGSADLDTWTPQPHPIIATPPTGLALTAYRDHCVWFEDGVWRQLVGSGIQGQGGCAFMYESHDFTTWSEMGALVIGDAGEPDLTDPSWTGTMWECVDFFRMVPGAGGTTGVPDGRSGEPHVLIFSAWHEDHTLHSMAAVGTYNGRRFVPETYQRLDFGGRFAYAPQSFIDDDGRRVLWAWMQEGRTDAAQYAASWSGAMAVPRHIWLSEDLRVCAEPVQEISQLRASSLTVNTAGDINAVRVGQAVDIESIIQLPVGSAVEYELLATQENTDDGELTLLRLHRTSPAEVTISLDRSSSSLDITTDGTLRSGAIPLELEQPLKVRVLLDRSSVEVFAEGVSLTARVYPTRDDADSLSVRSVDGADVQRTQVWRMKATEQPNRSMYPGVG